MPSLPVIFISSNNEPQGKVKAFEVGGVDYMTKPFYFIFPGSHPNDASGVSGV